jgi:F0F1-type ATP synthase gamma subunit
MQKAVTQTCFKPYGIAAKKIIEDITSQVSGSDIHSSIPERKQRSFIVITTDKGLCGSLNSRIIKKLVDEFDKEKLTS